MNREIKFRGFSEELKCFVYGFYHEVEAEGVGYSYIFFQGHTTPVRADSVSQFTGQYDKKLKEIYEDDIVGDWTNVDGIMEQSKQTVYFDELLETIKNNSIDNKCTIENVDLFVKSWTKEAETLQLRKADVMARCFKNYKGQFFIYKSRITKSETKFKVVRNFESQGRTVLVSENNNKYYLHEVAPYNEP